jgi:hypothetical protein
MGMPSANNKMYLDRNRLYLANIRHSSRATAMAMAMALGLSRARPMVQPSSTVRFLTPLLLHGSKCAALFQCLDAIGKSPAFPAPRPLTHFLQVRHPLRRLGPRIRSMHRPSPTQSLPRRNPRPQRLRPLNNWRFHQRPPDPRP